MKWDGEVTFENPDCHSPETVLVRVEADQPGTAAGRAIKEARRLKPGKHFESIVLLLRKAGDLGPEALLDGGGSPTEA